MLKKNSSPKIKVLNTLPNSQLKYKKYKLLFDHKQELKNEYQFKSTEHPFYNQSIANEINYYKKKKHLENADVKYMKQKII